MPFGSREFVLSEVAGAGSDVLQVLADTASDGLGWANGSAAHTRRRTWLDTFDWLLHRAGLTLEQVASGGRVELVLTGRNGEVLATEQPPAGRRLSWPRLVSELPDGPLRARLQPVAGVRALLPVARAVSKVGELHAVNSDAKTVARLAVDRMAVTFPAKATAPARLTVAPVRGYQSQADKVGRVIAAMPGVRADNGSLLEAALAAVGRQVGDLPGKPTGVHLTSSMPAATAMAAILTALLDVIEANVPGTVKDIDTEFLHDLRVAVRWTRSALKLCGSALPAGLASAYRPEFRWLGDLTTPARDLDVYLLGYPGMAAGLVGAAEGDLIPFREQLERSRADAQRRLTAGLRSARFGRLRIGWRAALADVRPARRRPTVGQLADARITAAHRQALRTGGHITASSPAQSLHDLRKRCKELRYLVEMFGSLHDPRQRSQAVRELKALQDCLGEFQDAEVQRNEIRAFAGQMLEQHTAPAETLLAMGEIAASMAQRQIMARAQFEGRFADFAGPASQARLAALARTAAG